MGPSGRKRVVVTRSRKQSSELASRLEALGMEAISVPTIEIVPPESFAELDAGVAELASFDWVLFTSANAVRAFAERGGRGLAGVRVSAIGPATARALGEVAMTVDLLPEVAVAESLGEALLPFAAGARMLLVRAETGREVLPERLRAGGAEVVVAPAYRNVVPEGSVPLVRALFADAERWPDAMTFTSSSTVTNLFGLMEAAGVQLPRGEAVVRASIGPITSATLEEVRYPAHVEAREATVGSLAEALAERLLR